ncbi:uncharacterized protein LOC106878220 isoform X1 [Octopus bimaculoides]|uniref:Uncharacterized protein n=1 Tax=Octopus bimaculoides TaxID=37653 RepID=A0A0L8G9W7_OCTBM|nr:uncharacterized protein LOC106878220 isoform X1 [Octopus bimaculoides]|eukprot:XP_014782857.1 PREDICTED: uncharacterized protein LOC106878220 isoform X1 [Octopus bimaculoides]
MLALKSSNAKKFWESFEIYCETTSEELLSDQSGWCEFEKSNVIFEEFLIEVMISRLVDKTFHRSSKDPEQPQKQLSWSEATDNKVDEEVSEEERKYFKIIEESQAGVYEDLAEDEKTSRILQSYLHHQLPRTPLQIRMPQISGGQYKQYKPKPAYEIPRRQSHSLQRHSTVPMTSYEQFTEEIPSVTGGWSYLILPRAHKGSTEQEDALSNPIIGLSAPPNPVHYMTMDELWGNLNAAENMPLTVVPSTYSELQAYPANQKILKRSRIPIRKRPKPSRLPVRIKNFPLHLQTSSSLIPMGTPSRIPLRTERLLKRRAVPPRMPARLEHFRKIGATPSRIPLRTEYLPKRHTMPSRIPIRHTVPSRIPIRTKRVLHRGVLRATKPAGRENLFGAMPSRIPVRIPRRRRMKSVSFEELPSRTCTKPLRMGMERRLHTLQDPQQLRRRGTFYDIKRAEALEAAKRRRDAISAMYRAEATKKETLLSPTKRLDPTAAQRIALERIKGVMAAQKKASKRMRELEIQKELVKEAWRNALPTPEEARREALGRIRSAGINKVLKSVYDVDPMITYDIQLKPSCAWNDSWDEPWDDLWEEPWEDTKSPPRSETRENTVREYIDERARKGATAAREVKALREMGNIRSAARQQLRDLLEGSPRTHTEISIPDFRSNEARRRYSRIPVRIKRGEKRHRPVESLRDPRYPSRGTLTSQISLDASYLGCPVHGMGSPKTSTRGTGSRRTSTYGMGSPRI